MRQRASAWPQCSTSRRHWGCLCCRPALSRWWTLGQTDGYRLAARTPEGTASGRCSTGTRPAAAVTRTRWCASRSNSRRPWSRKQQSRGGLAACSARAGATHTSLAGQRSAAGRAAAAQAAHLAYKEIPCRSGKRQSRGPPTQMRTRTSASAGMMLTPSRHHPVKAGVRTTSMVWPLVRGNRSAPGPSARDVTHACLTLGSDHTFSSTFSTMSDGTTLASTRVGRISRPRTCSAPRATRLCSHETGSSSTAITPFSSARRHAARSSLAGCPSTTASRSAPPAATTWTCAGRPSGKSSRASTSTSKVP